MSNSTSLTITFIDGSEDTEAQELVDAERVALNLDDDANSSATSFSSGTHAFVRQIPSGPSTLYTNIGSARKSASSIPLAVEDEYLDFALSDEATLDYAPYSVVTWEWVGSDGGQPTFNGRKVTLKSEVVGRLRCSYTTLSDQIEVSYTGGETNLLLVVDKNGVTDSLSIPFTVDATEGDDEITEDDDGNPLTRNVVLIIKDYCTDAAVPYASVTLSGTGYPATSFTADANGEADFGYLVIGKTYTIVVSASGYLASDSDSLSNDTFTVS